MGGVGAWKEREKEAKERTMKWDLEEREAERERMEEAKENGEVDDEAYDRYAEMADEQHKDAGEDCIPKTADDDVSSLALTSYLSLTVVVFHDGHDAKNAQH